LLKNSTIRNAILILLLSLLLIGVIHLFMLRFQAGDIYPAYSSLRSDPLGTRVFYDSLDNFDEFRLQRNYHLLDSLKIDSKATFFYLGAEIPAGDFIPERTRKALDRLTQSGGRLVIAYLPVHQKSAKTSCSGERSDCTKKPAAQTEDERQGQRQEQIPDSAPVPPPNFDDPEDTSFKQEVAQKNFVSIKKHWGFEFAYNDNLLVQDSDEQYPSLEANSLRPGLPAVISWHTNLYFELFDDSWQTLYAVDDNPVIIERPMGQGSIVLCADSFFISNEAQRSERHPQLLVYLLGGHRDVIFDESHFGIYKQPGVAGLLRHYRFHWFFGALALVALLFVWKNTVYFVPPRPEDITGGAAVVSEKDYSQGLIALLRRNIRRRNILQICGQEWERTFKHDRRLTPGAVEQMKRILQTESESSKKKSDPVAGYQKISNLLKRIGIYTVN